MRGQKPDIAHLILSIDQLNTFTMKKSVLFIWALILPSLALFAQNETDALRFSMIDPGGTARFAGMGGAFGALGGDFSALSINPAGIGIYRSSELSLTPALGYHQAETSYFNQTEVDMKYSFNLNNFGVVLSLPVGSQLNEGGWKYVNFGFGINRHNNFNSRWIAEGYNNQNSLMTDMLDQAISEGSVANLSDFSTGLAWDTYLLDTDDQGFFFVDMENGNVLQRQETNTSGYIREFTATVGANYNDRIYFGATVGVPTVRYKEENTFVERDINNTNDFFNSLTYKYEQETKGNGVNFKLGTIVRLSNMFRLGLALHTPTFYNLDRSYSASMRSDLNLDPDEYPDYTEDAKFAESPQGLFKYDLQTPLKAVGSLGIIFGQAGLISLDYEYVDYTKSRLRSSDYSFSTENKAIADYFSAQHNIRLGGEISLSPMFLRAGYGLSTNPYQEDINDATRSALSFGIGMREQDYFIDFSYTYSFFSEDYYPYMIAPQAMARDFSDSSFRLTVGWKF
jgi:hypothetical protein